MVILGVLIVGFGILILVARDFFWALTEMSNSFAGRQSERTELWEAGQMISGIILIGLGAFVICAGTAEANEREQERVAPTQTAVAVAATAVWFSDALGEDIAEWESVATDSVVRVDPASIGFDASDIYYGHCDNGAFFVALYEIGSRYGDDYLYLSEREPHQCITDNLRFYSVGGGRPWWKVNLFVDEQPQFPVLQATLDAISTRQEQATSTRDAIITATHARTLMPRLTATRDADSTRQAVATATPRH